MTSPEPGIPQSDDGADGTPAVPAVPAAGAPVPGGPAFAGGTRAAGGAAARARDALAEPVLPEQSREDTDIAWGEYPGPADDRLDRDRPPHWADF